jgi:prepilin-type N-terminal cleavage/methylation domain-containing protein
MEYHRTSFSLNSRGFTILELLVSVAIIGILAALTVVIVNGVRAKGRDGRRVQDITQIQNALNLYYTNKGVFPVAASETILQGNDAVSQALINEHTIPEIPGDPSSPAYEYTYISATGTTYTISFCMETNTSQPYPEGCDNTVNP